MAPIDYSKWDKLSVSSDDDNNIENNSAIQTFDVEANDNQFRHQVEIEGPSSTARSAALSSRDLRVSQFSKPTSVVIKPRDQKPVDEKERKSRPITAGGISADGWIIWEQSAREVNCWIKGVPSSLSNDKKPMGVHLKEGLPDKDDEMICTMGMVAASCSATSENNSKSPFGHVAHGFVIEWLARLTGETSNKTASTSTGGTSPTATTTDGTTTCGPWVLQDGQFVLNRNLSMPVMGSEDDWLWIMEDECPYSGDVGRYIHLQLKKMSTKWLGPGVGIWWKTLFNTTDDPIVAVEAKQEADDDGGRVSRGVKFAQNWAEANRIFREKHGH